MKIFKDKGIQHNLKPDNNCISFKDHSNNFTLDATRSCQTTPFHQVKLKLSTWKDLTVWIWQTSHSDPSFPVRDIQMQHILLHRPMNWIRRHFIINSPAVFIATDKTVSHLRKRHAQLDFPNPMCLPLGLRLATHER